MPTQSNYLGKLSIEKEFNGGQASGKCVGAKGKNVLVGGSPWPCAWWLLRSRCHLGGLCNFADQNSPTILC